MKFIVGFMFPLCSHNCIVNSMKVPQMNTTQPGSAHNVETAKTTRKRKKDKGAIQ